MGANAYENWGAELMIEVWEGPGQTSATTIDINLASAAANTSAGGSVLSISGGWIRPKNATYNLAATGAVVGFVTNVALGICTAQSPIIYTPNTQMGTWNMAQATGTDRRFFLPLTVSPEYANSILPWSATRLNSVAALFTSTTKVLNKEGTALWGRINPNLTNPFRVTSADIQTLHPAEKAYMDLERGCYAYNPPSTDLATFRNCVRKAGSFGGNFQFPVFRLDNDAFTAHGFFNDADGGTTLAVNVDYHIEFRTSSTLFQVGVSSTQLEVLHQAQIGLLKAGFFFNNIDHTAIIKAIIGGLASMHPLLRVAAPLAQGLMGASSVALSSRPSTKQRPTTTSGSRSGIVERKKAPNPRVEAWRRSVRAPSVAGSNRSRKTRSSRVTISTAPRRRRRP